jgi:hypothetical protein
VLDKPQANYFDRFDGKPSDRVPPGFVVDKTPGNYFDQFDTPAYDSPDFDKALATKYGARPEDVAALKQSMGSTEALKGIPIAGGLVDKLGGYARAASPMPGGASGDTFGERAARNTAMQAEIAEAYEAAHPTASTAAQLVGGTAALGPLGATATGARALGIVGGGLGRQMAASTASGTIMGGLDAAVRGGDPGSASAIGGTIGAFVPPAARFAGLIASPLISNIAARINPAGAARDQFARGVLESGRTPAEIAADVTQASREGQPYTVADAMGNAGQRMLSSVARAPGEGRTDVVNFLEQRQAGQGRRVAGQLAEGFDSPQTAAQVGERLTRTRDAVADADYGAARQNAGPVDVSPVVANIDATLTPGANQIARPQSGIRNDTIESALQGIRERLTDNRSMLTDFTALQRVRGDVADQVQQAVSRQQGNRARLLGGVLRTLDAQMEAASPGFAQANRNFEAASRNIDAIGEGRTAAMRGRTQDTIPAFQGLPPRGQSAFRAGYVDPLIEQTQGAAFGVNKARPFTSDAFAAESNAMAPGAGQMQRQLGRENTMFETRNQALGGSRTADNLADAAALGDAAHLATSILSGHPVGLARTALGFVSRALTGSTPAVRSEVAQLLLQRGGMISAGGLSDAIQAATNRVTMRDFTGRLIGGIGGRLAAQQLATPETKWGRLRRPNAAYAP